MARTTNTPIDKTPTTRTRRANKTSEREVARTAPTADGGRKRKAADREVPTGIKMVAPPHVHKTAAVVETRKVKNARVIKVKGAMYRGATFDAILELEPNKDVQMYRDKTVRASVSLKWFEWEPQKGYARVTVDAKNVEILEKYTGDVAVRLGKAD